MENNIQYKTPIETFPFLCILSVNHRRESDGDGISELVAKWGRYVYWGNYLFIQIIDRRIYMYIHPNNLLGELYIHPVFTWGNSLFIQIIHWSNCLFIQIVGGFIHSSPLLEEIIFSSKLLGDSNIHSNYWVNHIFIQHNFHSQKTQYFRI